MLTTLSLCYLNFNILKVGFVVVYFFKMPQREVIPGNKTHMGGLLEEERNWAERGQKLVPGHMTAIREREMERKKEKEREMEMGGGKVPLLLKGNVANVHKKCS